VEANRRLFGKRSEPQAAVANADAKTAKKTWYKLVKGVMTVVPAQSWQVVGDSGNKGAGIHF
jgi:hypothetical protein